MTINIEQYLIRTRMIGMSEKDYMCVLGSVSIGEIGTILGSHLLETSPDQ